MEQIKIEDIKVGDKVIRADGLAGKVVDITVGRYGDIYAEVHYENGDINYICNYTGETPCDRKPLTDFYLIGKTILGNKVEVSEIEQRIEQNKQRIAEIKKENDQLRKQAWRLRNTMNGQYPLPADKKEGEEV